MAVCLTGSDYFRMQSIESANEVDKWENVGRHIGCLWMPSISLVTERQKQNLQIPCEILEYEGIYIGIFKHTFGTGSIGFLVP